MTPTTSEDVGAETPLCICGDYDQVKAQITCLTAASTDVYAKLTQRLKQIPATPEEISNELSTLMAQLKKQSASPRQFEDLKTQLKRLPHTKPTQMWSQLTGAIKKIPETENIITLYFEHAKKTFKKACRIPRRTPS